jgi:hypothetical protein
MRRLALLAGVVVLAGCGGGGGVPRSAVAVVGGRSVSRADLAAALAQSRRAYAAGGRAFPAAGTPAFDHLRALALGVLVDRARLEVVAAKHGITITPAQVDTALRRYVQESFGGDEKRFRESLRREGMTEAGIRAALRTQLLAAAVTNADAAGEKVKVRYARGFAPPNGS